MRRVDIDKKTLKGNTALHAVLMMKLGVEYVRPLLECGARVDVLNNAGKTTLDLVREEQDEAVVELFSDKFNHAAAASLL